LHGNNDGTVPATFQIIYMVNQSRVFVLDEYLKGFYIQIGWKPATTQPKPLERGTAQTNLQEVL
jgi:NADH dehydrogenase [ubiquinone] 1 alpha subcomplex assembly factor 5